MDHHLHLEPLRVSFKDLLLLCLRVDDLLTAVSFLFDKLGAEKCNDACLSLVWVLSFHKPSYDADLLTVMFVSKPCLVAGVFSLTDTGCSVCVEESFVIQQTTGKGGDVDDLGLLIVQLLNESSLSNIDSETDHVD